MCVLLQSPARGVTVECAAAVSSPWCHCCVCCCSPQSVVLLLCVPLQSPARGDTVVCAAAVPSPWCYCCVCCCSPQPVVLLLCVLLQSPVRVVTMHTHSGEYADLARINSPGSPTASKMHPRVFSGAEFGFGIHNCPPPRAIFTVLSVFKVQPYGP